MSTLNDWFKEQFKPDPEILGMLEKAKKQEYNKKEENKFDASINAAAALAINGAENAAKAAGIDTSKNNNNSAGISAIASLAKSGAENATKALASATKKTNSTQQKPKEVTKTDAEKMMDYLYDEKNLPKTEDFLFNNGFPSREDREYNKEFFGEQEEKKQTVDLFKAKTNSVLNPTLPNKSDRLFLKGLMGDEEEERDYNKQVEDNKKAKSDYAFAFRGSPFEQLFADPQNPPAGMPLKKQDPIEELMAKYEQYQKNKTAEGTASKALDLVSDATGFGELTFKQADNQLNRFNIVNPSSAKYNPSKAMPGTIDIDITPEWKRQVNQIADDINNGALKPLADKMRINDFDTIRTRYNNGKFEVSGYKHALENADSKTMAKAIQNFEKFELPTKVNDLLKNADGVSTLKSVVKNGKAVATVAGGIGDAVVAIDTLGFVIGDIVDDRNWSQESSKKLGSSFGDWAGSALGTKAGVSLGSAIGTAICPGLGTVIGGFIGGVVGGIAGGYAGDKLGEEAGVFLDETVRKVF